MSLTTSGTAFALVAVVFIAAGMVTGSWGLGVGDSGTARMTRQSWSAIARAVWPGATFEALVLTLVAALWFGSLGHGGWVILFLLLGALPAGDRWLRRRLSGQAAGREAWGFVASLLKYLLAGLVCVWRLT
jgi:hypothetical protein